MNKTSPLIKRIKRHVSGPVQYFFAVTPPGLEKLCKEEIEKLIPEAADINQTDGGVEFRGKLHSCYLANMYLRTANRILMRLTEFKSTNFRKLEKKLNDFPWELYLMKESIPYIHVTAKHSRLYHSSAISGRLIKSIEERKKNISFLSSTGTGTYPQNIFFRVIDDRITISLDSSGELLYKRGIKQHTGPAPLRETLAAAALIKSGYRGDVLLYDPMCGTGTFSIEAAMIAGNIPPGLNRNFAFESWPAFKPAQWAYLKKEASKDIKPWDSAPYIIAGDKDASMCTALEETLEKFGMNKIIKVLNTDFFNTSPDDIYKNTKLQNPGLIIINPPYGIRLGTEQESVKMFFKITERLLQFYAGWKFALFLPENWPLEKSGMAGDKLLIDHGGIKLILFTGKIKG